MLALHLLLPFPSLPLSPMGMPTATTFLLQFLNKNRLILSFDNAHQPLNLVEGRFLSLVLVQLRQVIEQVLDIFDALLY